MERVPFTTTEGATSWAGALRATGPAKEGEHQQFSKLLGFQA